MKKFRGFFIALFVLIMVIVGLWVIKTPLVASYLSNKLKTSVSISDIYLSSHKFIIKEFKMKNPENSKSRYALIANAIEVEYSFKKIFSSPITIDNIVVNDIILNIECSNPLCTKNNWTTIVNNINQNEPKKESSKALLIKNLIIKNMDAEIFGLGLDFTKTKKSHIAQMQFSNINSKTGFPTKQLIAAIFKSAGLNDYLKGILDTKKMIENIIDTFKGISDNSLEESLNSI